MLFIVSGLLLVLIAQFINLKDWFNPIDNFLKTYTFFFLLFRLVLYGATFYLWPRFIRWSISNHQTLTSEQISTMISARNFLLATIFIQEVLNWLR